MTSSRHPSPLTKSQFPESRRGLPSAACIPITLQPSGIERLRVIRQGAHAVRTSTVHARTSVRFSQGRCAFLDRQIPSNLPTSSFSTGLSCPCALSGSRCAAVHREAREARTGSPSEDASEEAAAVTPDPGRARSHSSFDSSSERAI